MAGRKHFKLQCLIIFAALQCVICVNYQPKAITITQDNWADILEGEWMVEFMAPWCPACRGFTETWNKFAKWSRDLDVSVGVVDVTENPGLSGRFLVTALPTIYHVKDGVFRQYTGGRMESDLISFIDDKKWSQVEPVSKWISPDSIQMGTVGLFFKVAMHIRSFYTLMTTEYGIPEWGCYLIFAVMTILAGLVLGLLIVCCCDMMFPVKEIPPEPLRYSAKRPIPPGAEDTPIPDDADEGDDGDNVDDDDDDDSDGDIIDDTKDMHADGHITPSGDGDASSSAQPEVMPSASADDDNTARKRQVRKED